MLEITTGVAVGLEISGKEYPLENGGFQSLTIVANKRMSATSVELIVSDISGEFERSITLSDGTPFTVKIGRSLSSFETYKFRVFNFKKIPSGSVSMYHIIGYWDSPSWFFYTVKKAIEGTSSEVIEQLASACELESDVDSTNDSMLWLPRNTRYCQFARNVCERGYADDDSLMVLGMTLNGQIRYWNLNLTADDPNSIPKFVHSDTGSPNTYIVFDHSNISKSGFGNAMGGYMHKVRQQSVIEEQQAIDSLNVKRMSQQLMMNKQIRQSMESGRIDIAPVDCGNVHDNWNRARYQNQRNANVYSLGVELLIRQQTADLDLFDEFVYEAYDPPGAGEAKPNGGYKGTYVVTAKAIHAQVGNYYEKIQGFSTGLSDDADGLGTQE